MTESTPCAEAGDVNPIHQALINKLDSVQALVEHANVIKHNAAKGDICEALAIQLLADTLEPVGKSVAQGFACDHKGTLSRQIDILLCEPLMPPTFLPGSVCLAPLETVLATVEVKYRRNTPDLKKMAKQAGEGMEGLTRISLGPPRRILKCLFVMLRARDRADLNEQSLQMLLDDNDLHSICVMGMGALISDSLGEEVYFSADGHYQEVVAFLVDLHTRLAAERLRESDALGLVSSLYGHYFGLGGRGSSIAGSLPTLAGQPRCLVAIPSDDCGAAIKNQFVLLWYTHHQGRSFMRAIDMGMGKRGIDGLNDDQRSLLVDLMSALQKTSCKAVIDIFTLAMQSSLDGSDRSLSTQTVGLLCAMDAEDLRLFWIVHEAIAWRLARSDGSSTLIPLLFDEGSDESEHLEGARDISEAILSEAWAKSGMRGSPSMRDDAFDCKIHLQSLGLFEFRSQIGPFEMACGVGDKLMQSGSMTLVCGTGSSLKFGGLKFTRAGLQLAAILQARTAVSSNLRFAEPGDYAITQEVSTEYRILCKNVLSASFDEDVSDPGE